jgi:hypothetical protein
MAVKKAPKAYNDKEFLNSPQARSIRILAEYIEPQTRFWKQKVKDTIVFYGSARIPSKAAARAALQENISEIRIRVPSSAFSPR